MDKWIELADQVKEDLDPATLDNIQKLREKRAEMLKKSPNPKPELIINKYNEQYKDYFEKEPIKDDNDNDYGPDISPSDLRFRDVG